MVRKMDPPGARYMRWVLVIAVLVASLAIHLLNLSFLGKDHPGALRSGVSIRTQDDVSYLVPALNYLDGKGWRTNDAGVQAYFLRPPGYGLLFALGLWLFGHGGALYFLIGLQLLLHALAAWWVYAMLQKYTSQKLAWLAALLMGCLPMFSGFLFYTLTEGISPALLCLYIYLLWRYTLKNGSWTWLAGAALAAAGLLLLRPVLGVFLGLLPLSIVIRQRKRPGLLWGSMLMAGVLTLLPMGMWQYRNYQLSGQWVGLHPVYHPTSPGIFRPAHRAMWNFCKSWGMTGPEFHTLAHGLFDRAVAGDTSGVHRQGALEQIPGRVRERVSDDLLLEGFARYQQNSWEQAVLTKAFSQPMPDTLSEAEQLTIAHFERLRQDYVQAYPFHVGVEVPLGVLRQMVMHSNLNLYVFQHSWRGKPPMEVFRVLSLILHSLMFLALLPGLWLWRKNPFWWGVILGSLVYVIYLAWFQRGIEERYTLPLLPLLWFNMVIVADRMVRWWGGRIGRMKFEV